MREPKSESQPQLFMEMCKLPLGRKEGRKEKILWDFFPPCPPSNLAGAGRWARTWRGKTGRQPGGRADRPCDCLSHISLGSQAKNTQNPVLSHKQLGLPRSDAFPVKKRFVGEFPVVPAGGRVEGAPMLGWETTTWAHPAWQWGAGSSQQLSLGMGLEKPLCPPSPPRASAAPFARAGETAPGFFRSQAVIHPVPLLGGGFPSPGDQLEGVPGEEEEELLPRWVPSGSPSVPKPCCPRLARAEVGLCAPAGRAVLHGGGSAGCQGEELFGSRSGAASGTSGLLSPVPLPRSGWCLGRCCRTGWHGAARAAGTG